MAYAEYLNLKRLPEPPSSIFEMHEFLDIIRLKTIWEINFILNNNKMNNFVFPCTEN